MGVRRKDAARLAAPGAGRGAELHHRRSLQRREGAAMNEREQEERRYRIGMWIKLTLTALALLGWIIELKNLGAF